MFCFLKRRWEICTQTASDRYLSRSFSIQALPFTSYREQLQTVLSKRRQTIMESFRLCFRELQKETGTVALHLCDTPSGFDSKKLILIDAIGCKHELPLEKINFLIQYKQPLWTNAFLTALKSGDRPEAERILEALFNNVIERGKKGILNEDRSFLRNYGFDGEKAYQIDVGTFFRLNTLSRSAAFKKSVRDSMDPIQEWLAEIDPAILQHLNKKLDTIQY